MFGTKLKCALFRRDLLNPWQRKLHDKTNLLEVLFLWLHSLTCMSSIEVWFGLIADKFGNCLRFVWWFVLLEGAWYFDFLLVNRCNALLTEKQSSLLNWQKKYVWWKKTRNEEGIFWIFWHKILGNFKTHLEFYERSNYSFFNRGITKFAAQI